jgi:hypothetical protein
MSCLGFKGKTMVTRVWLERLCEANQKKAKRNRVVHCVYIPKTRPTKNKLLRAELLTLHSTIRARIDHRLRDGQVIGCIIWKICVCHEGRMVTNVDDLIEWTVARIALKALGNRPDLVPINVATVNSLESFLFNDILDWNVYKHFIPGV